MIQRQVVVPADVDRLWRALTDPDEAGRWLGGRLQWEPREGGRLRFVPDEGVAREGRVEEVVPRRCMRFVWWPAGDRSEPASEVVYTLEPVGPPSEPDDPQGVEATILTVEEAPAPAPSASASLAVAGSDPGASWTLNDDMLWRTFAGCELAGAVA